MAICVIRVSMPNRQFQIGINTAYATRNWKFEMYACVCVCQRLSTCLLCAKKTINRYVFGFLNLWALHEHKMIHNCTSSVCILRLNREWETERGKCKRSESKKKTKQNANFSSITSCNVWFSWILGKIATEIQLSTANTSPIGVYYWMDLNFLMCHVFVWRCSFKLLIVGHYTIIHIISV